MEAADDLPVRRSVCLGYNPRTRLRRAEVPDASEEESRVTQDNAAAARRLYEEVMPSGDPAAADGVFAADFLNHAAVPGSPGGIEGARAQISTLAAAFDEQSYDIEQVVSAGDRVASYCTWNARHIGEFLGIPPTQRRFSSRQAHFLRFDPEGRVAEHWAVRDDLSMLRQMGIAPG